ncbi:unnamed protein product [Callosobruchus maculatus]|uniref:Uncharacterized protein n=1 Tax=Callosobruchus maculatus TaxID=64391 RepID=A0A653D6Y9_CALMS|nr:unnamed protein product [Callosobruchus maculatus]
MCGEDQSVNFKKFNSLDKRLLTFSKWPNHVDPLPIAIAGYFYAGSGDICEAFCCGNCIIGEKACGGIRSPKVSLSSPSQTERAVFDFGRDVGPPLKSPKKFEYTDDDSGCRDSTVADRFTGGGNERTNNCNK